MDSPEEATKHEFAGQDCRSAALFESFTGRTARGARRGDHASWIVDEVVTIVTNLFTSYVY